MKSSKIKFSQKRGVHGPTRPLNSYFLRKLQIFILQITDFAKYRFSFRFIPFRFANYSKPQYTRKNSLEICGIPQDAFSNTEAAIIKVAQALNVTNEDIEILHKLKHGRSIIVKFHNHKRKSKLYYRAY